MEQVGGDSNIQISDSMLRSSIVFNSALLDSKLIESSHTKDPRGEIREESKAGLDEDSRDEQVEDLKAEVNNLMEALALCRDNLSETQKKLARVEIEKKNLDGLLKQKYSYSSKQFSLRAQLNQ